MKTGGILSPRQVEIIRLIRRGCTDKEIAGELAISRGTVKTHMRIILSKLGAKSRSHAVFRYRD